MKVRQVFIDGPCAGTEQVGENAPARLVVVADPPPHPLAEPVAAVNMAEYRRTGPAFKSARGWVAEYAVAE